MRLWQRHSGVIALIVGFLALIFGVVAISDAITPPLVPPATAIPSATPDPLQLT